MNAERRRSTAIAARLSSAPSLRPVESKRGLATTAQVTERNASQATPRAATSAQHAPQTTRTRPKPLGGHTTHNALCTPARAMHAGRRALHDGAGSSRSREAGCWAWPRPQRARPARRGRRRPPPPSVAEWASRDDPGASNAEQRFAQWKRVDDQLVASGAAKSNAIYDARWVPRVTTRRWRGASEI